MSSALPQLMGATAVRRLVARLADRHGLAFVRDVADELVAELAEATSTIMPEAP